MSKVESLLNEQSQIDCKKVEILKGSINEISSNLHEKINRCLTKKSQTLLKSVYDSIKDLSDLLTAIPPIGDYFGLYRGNTNPMPTIYLCMENIANEARNKNVSLADLAESVLVHEYTHHVHCSHINYSINGKNCEKKYVESAVKETVAETVQYIFAVELDKVKNQYTLTDWVQKHTEKGLFPGWGYGGERILRQVASSLNIEISLLDNLLSFSFDNLKKAYEMLKTLDLFANGPISCSVNKYSIVLSDTTNVWAFTDDYVPYTLPKNTSKSIIQVAIAKDLEDSLNKLQANNCFLAEFSGMLDMKTDIENILFYNHPKNCRSVMQNLMAGGVEFLKCEMPVISQDYFKYYYHYKTESSNSCSLPKSICAEWSNCILKKSPKDSPFNYYEMIKNNQPTIKAKLSKDDIFGLSVTISAPNSKYKLNIDKVKHMIDGIICAFHELPWGNLPPNYIDDAATKIAKNYFTPNKIIVGIADIKKMFNKTNCTCLFPHKYYYEDPNSPNKGWNPQDNLLRQVSIKLKYDSSLSDIKVSGNIYKL